MVEIIGVRFSNAGKIYYFNPDGHKVVVSTHVLVETSRGMEMGRVVIANKEVDESEIVPPLKSIIRVATAEDFEQVRKNKEDEKQAFKIALEKIREHKIDMKLIDVEYTFDRNKILFYFTADGRVDFRELVKSLASVFRTRIELRQIGVRDEARLLGSYGICGRYLCCGTFLDDFRPVSIKMSKEQGLSLNPAKISGTCGRLMCCLQYEQNAYDDMLKKLPRKGETVDTPDGPGIVSDVATLKGTIRVRFENGESVKYETYKLGEFSTKNSAGKHQNAEANAEESFDIQPTDEIAEGSEIDATVENVENIKNTKNIKNDENAEGNSEKKPYRPNRRNRRRPGGNKHHSNKRSSDKE